MESRNAVEEQGTPERSSNIGSRDPMPLMTEMERCLEKASAKGYSAWFRATEDGLKCLDSGRVYQPNEVRVPDFFVLKVFRIPMI